MITNGNKKCTGFWRQVILWPPLLCLLLGLTACGEKLQAADNTAAGESSTTQTESEPPAAKAAEPPTAAEVTTAADTEPPVIKGAKDIEAKPGDSIAYRKDVTVTDNSGETIVLQIDSSAVKTDSIGEYKAVYRAADSAGNTAEETITVRIVSVTTKELNVLADEVLAGIIQPGMSKAEQVAQAIKWIRNSVRYNQTRNRSGDWRNAAYMALQNKAGSCFEYAAALHILLERLEFESLLIERGCLMNSDAFTNYLEAFEETHFWLFVKADGGWYYADPTPSYMRVGLNNYGKLMTQSDVDAWMKAWNIPYYYYYDESAVSFTPVA
ncbi:MAG: HYR domain-containing protein [Oscillospiraceae bacterium]|jgi:hypothetical protein|nr:HYR domain-containing protein [Oscillospiraceae bacterium]